MAASNSIPGTLSSTPREPHGSGLVNLSGLFIYYFYLYPHLAEDLAAVTSVQPFVGDGVSVYNKLIASLYMSLKLSSGPKRVRAYL